MPYVSKFIHFINYWFIFCYPKIDKTRKKLPFIVICLYLSKEKIDVIVLAKSSLIGVLMHLRHSVNIK